MLSIDEIQNIDTNLVPSIWIEAFKSTNEKRMILQEWEKRCKLNNTILYLNDYLQDIDIIKTEDGYSLLYTIKNEYGSVLFYEGRNPKESLNGLRNKKIGDAWKAIPCDVKAFYECIHNGFYDYTSKSMGLVSLESVICLNDYEWGIIEDLNESIKISLEKSFGFFSNGMGDHVVIDCSNCSNENVSLWFHNDQPEYNLNFWNVVDEWMVVGFQS